MLAPGCTAFPSSAHPQDQSISYIPAEDYERLGVVATDEQQVIVGKPALQNSKTSALAARLDFGNQRTLVLAEDVNIDIARDLPITACAAVGHTLGLDAEVSMQVDNL